jgi:cytochrome c556
MAAEPTLKEIMQGLRDDFVEISDALLVDELVRISLAAARISGHAAVTKQQGSIIAGELGDEMQKFKKFDGTVHSLSESIKQAADNNDHAQILSAYNKMFGACLECHTNYKERVSNVLRAAEQ